MGNRLIRISRALSEKRDTRVFFEKSSALKECFSFSRNLHHSFKLIDEKWRSIKKRRKNHLKRFSFTFLELLTCLALLALVGTFLIIKAQPMISFYQFKGGINHLVRELAWTQKMATISSGYVDFMIEHKKNKLLCKRQTDEASGDTIKGFNHSFTIDHVSKITFEGREKDQIQFDFNPLGFIFPKGKLMIYSTHNEEVYLVEIPSENGEISYKKISSLDDHEL